MVRHGATLSASWNRHLCGVLVRRERGDAVWPQSKISAAFKDRSSIFEDRFKKLFRTATRWLRKRMNRSAFASSVSTPQKRRSQGARSGVVTTPRWPNTSKPLLDGHRLVANGFHPDLAADLIGRYDSGVDAMNNHRAHAKEAEAELERLMLADEKEMTDAGHAFDVFLAYATEKMDGYGRLLAFLNRNQPAADNPGPRPPSYNDRLLKGGYARPYFIWPNIDPFRVQSDLASAVPPPDVLAAWIADARALVNARATTAAARTGKAGTWRTKPILADGDRHHGTNKPLMIDAHEFRAMWQLQPPHRWVVDMSGRHYGALIAPHRYTDVVHHEDRLYVPAEYVALWVERGWTRAT